MDDILVTYSHAAHVPVITALYPHLHIMPTFHQLDLEQWLNGSFCVGFNSTRGMIMIICMHAFPSPFPSRGHLIRACTALHWSLHLQTVILSEQPQCMWTKHWSVSIYDGGEP